MKIIKRILTVLGLKKEMTISRIIKPMAAIVAKLEEYDRQQVELVENYERTIERLKAEGAERRQAAVEARALASRYSALTTVVPAE